MLVWEGSFEANYVAPEPFDDFVTSLGTIFYPQRSMCLT